MFLSFQLLKPAFGKEMGRTIAAKSRRSQWILGFSAQVSILISLGEMSFIELGPNEIGKICIFFF